MAKKIDNLDWSTLRKVFSRMKKNTKGFTTLIVRDPTDFLDFEIDLQRNIESLVFRINSNRYHPEKPYIHLSPKNKGMNRETVVFNVEDALTYQFCIEQIENELLAKTRQQHIRGGIKIAPNLDAESDDFYEKWFPDWKKHLESIEAALDSKPFLVNTDIGSYFENINILVLKDMVRSEIEGKKKLLNLLFYFLENARLRVDYEVDTCTGLPQESVDCSRLLAYYFLHPHDNAMAEFCRENDAEFYRFVDDMSFAVNSEVVGKKALKCCTESLRRLNLVASVEKTSVQDSETARRELFFEENGRLSKLEETLLENLGNGNGVSQTVQEITDYYSELQAQRKYEYGNWIKILKRFYTLFTYAQSPFFLKQLANHAIQYPQLFSADKIGRYLLRNKPNEGFDRSLMGLVDYLYSEENLYPTVESSLLEIFLLFDPSSLSGELRQSLSTLSTELFFCHGYKPLSDYARAVCCLLFYRFNRNEISRIANHYLRSSENDFLLRKYMIFVALTVDNQRQREEVISKAKKEQHISIGRLANFIENLNHYAVNEHVKTFLRRDKVYIYKRSKKRFSIVENYANVRVQVLKELISIYR